MLEEAIEELNCSPKEIRTRRAERHQIAPPDVLARVLGKRVAGVQKRLAAARAGQLDEFALWELGNAALVVEVLTDDVAQQDVARQVREAVSQYFENDRPYLLQKVLHLSLVTG